MQSFKLQIMFTIAAASMNLCKAYYKCTCQVSANETRIFANTTASGGPNETNKLLLLVLSMGLPTPEEGGSPTKMHPESEKK